MKINQAFIYRIFKILVCAMGGAVLGGWFGVEGQIIGMVAGIWIGYFVSNDSN